MIVYSIDLHLILALAEDRRHMHGVTIIIRHGDRDEVGRLYTVSRINILEFNIQQFVTVGGNDC